MDDLFPCGAAGVGGTGEAEDERAVGDACDGARLDGGHADFVQRNGTKDFAEAVYGFVKQQGDGIGGDVAVKHACAACNQDDLDAGMGDGNGDAGADVVFFVAAEVAGMENVPALLQGLGEVVAAAVFFAAAGVGYGEDVDVEGAEVGGGHGELLMMVVVGEVGFQAALGYMIGQPERVSVL